MKCPFLLGKKYGKDINKWHIFVDGSHGPSVCLKVTVFEDEPVTGVLSSNREGFRILTSRLITCQTCLSHPEVRRYLYHPEDLDA